MSERYTPTQLRANLYALLDQVLDSGTPLEVVRRGRVLRIVPDQEGDPLLRIRTNPALINGDPEELVELDWSGEWNPDLP